MKHTHKQRMRTALALGLAVLASASVAKASLGSLYQFNGQGNWSLSGVGSNSSPVGNLEAIVPTGSTVVQAYLFSSLAYGTTSMSNITFNGTILTPSNFTSLGSNSLGLTAYYSDVTSLVSSVVGGGSASPFFFSVDESNNYGTDGEALAVVYSNPNEQTRTIAFLGGYSNSGGDQFTVNLSSPLPDPTANGFEAQLSLGIGFSYQGGGTQQYSNVDVNGRRLTSSAGGNDDGQGANGALITIGGIGDSTANPTNPFALPNATQADRTDDELYNLALGNGVDSTPFITQGLTSFTVNTQNPSGDDNIFFAGINITASAGVNQPAPSPTPSAVPEPGTYGLMGAAGLLGLGFLRRRKQQKK